MPDWGKIFNPDVEDYPGLKPGVIVTHKLDSRRGIIIRRRHCWYKGVGRWGVDVRFGSAEVLWCVLEEVELIRKDMFESEQNPGM